MAESIRGLDAFEETRRLIVVAAHPDDLETMCGGTVARLVQQGVQVFSVNCTLGDIGAPDDSQSRPALAATRLAETAAAAELLGLKGAVNLGHHDGELVADLPLRAEIARQYRLTQADTLLTFDPFWTGQIHPDHRAAGQAALDAYMPSKMPLYRPEQLAEAGADLGCLARVFLFATDRDPDIVIDITAVYDRKEAACLAHQSQFPRGRQDLAWLRKIDARRGQPLGVTYGESFKEMGVW